MLVNLGYDNALAETIIGVYKTEVIRRRGPWHTLKQVEHATLEWVDWFNNRRLLGAIGHVSLEEVEMVYCYHLTQTKQSLELLGRFKRTGLPLCELQPLLPMLVSRDFIFIHVPKTGGIFMRNVLHVLSEKSPHLFLLGSRRAPPNRWLAFLRKYYRPTLRNWDYSLHRLFVKNLYWRKDKASLLLIRWRGARRRKSGFNVQHANCECIPEVHQHKLVLSIKRDPLAYHVSCYCFRGGRVFWWRKRYWEQQYQRAVSKREVCRINSRQEGVPDFGEFVRFFNEKFPRMHFFRHKRCRLPSSIGFMSYIYIWYFFREPMKVLSKTDVQLAEYFESQRYRQDMYRVHFLRTEHLNADMHDFLLSRGFDREVLRFIPAQGKVNVSVATDPAAWFTSELIDYVKEKNRIYYRYFWCDGSAESTGALDGRV